MLVPLRSIKFLNLIHGQGDISPIKKLFLKRKINCNANKMFHFPPYPPSVSGHCLREHCDALIQLS